MVGVIGFGLVIGVRDAVAHRTASFQVAQGKPILNDMVPLDPFKNAYVGDASNDYNLSVQLPLGNMPHTIAIHPEQAGLEIRYEKSVGSIGTQNLHAILVYDATVDFALISNLNRLTFVFPGASLHTTRAQVQSWYGALSMPLWNREAQQKLSHRRYVIEAFAKLFDQAK